MPSLRIRQLLTTRRRLAAVSAVALVAVLAGAHTVRSVSSSGPDASASPMPGLRKAVIAPLDERTWRAMQGISWHVGCPIGRERLRRVIVPFVGFDGREHIGELIVADVAAKAAAAAFMDLHAQRFPIRSIFPVDRYGPMIGYPGGNDYASMAADNTSAFNCRYVDGKEGHRTLSPHATGTAIDINPWENPYTTRYGIYPNPRFALHRTEGPGLLTAGSAAVRALNARGFAWAGSWSATPDPQHLQYTGSPAASRQPTGDGTGAR